MTANHLADLRTIIERLDSCGRLTRVTTEVDPKFDLAGIAAHFESKPSAVLFEKVKGYDVPVFTGIPWRLSASTDGELVSFRAMR